MSSENFIEEFNIDASQDFDMKDINEEISGKTVFQLPQSSDDALLHVYTFQLFTKEM